MDVAECTIGSMLHELLKAWRRVLCCDVSGGEGDDLVVCWGGGRRRASGRRCMLTLARCSTGGLGVAVRTARQDGHRWFRARRLWKLYWARGQRRVRAAALRRP